MKKLLSVLSSVAVCVSAIAVSVLSYFPSPVKVDATAPDSSSLVTTILGSPNSFPVITFGDELLNHATSDIRVSLRFCPTGWVADSSSYVYPSSYGIYSDVNGYYAFTFTWAASQHKFIVDSYVDFASGLLGKKLFSNLTLNNVNNAGGVPTQLVHFSSVCPSDSPFSSTLLLYWGSSFDPSGLPCDVVFSLVGLIGNDYDLWHSLFTYDTGYSDGNSVGYSNGYSDGNSVGYSNGYSDGHSVGYQSGINDASHQFGMWNLFSNAFGSVGNILNIQLFPGLTIGLLISVPIAFAFILWLIHVLKG